MGSLLEERKLFSMRVFFREPGETGDVVSLPRSQLQQDPVSLELDNLDDTFR